MSRLRRWERATLIPYFCSLQGWYHAKLLFERIQQGKYSTNSPDPKIGWWKAKWFETSGLVQSDLLFYLNSMETNIAIASLSAPKNLILADVEKMEIKKANQQHHDLVAAFLPGFPGLNKSEISCFAMVRLATTSAAIERFRLEAKRLPQSLGELAPRFLPAVPTDPFDGQPLRYRRLAKGYLIYSVGQDGQDDGGREKPSDWTPGDKTTDDITFTVER
jgi:type II secretory pathway pseudopilin PulG